MKFWEHNYLTLASEHGIIVNSLLLGWRTGISAKVFGRQRRAPSIDTASVRGVCKHGWYSSQKPVYSCINHGDT